MNNMQNMPLLKGIQMYSFIYSFIHSFIHSLTYSVMKNKVAWSIAIGSSIPQGIVIAWTAMMVINLTNVSVHRVASCPGSQEKSSLNR